jgi:hypothetical protein
MKPRIWGSHVREVRHVKEDGVKMRGGDGGSKRLDIFFAQGTIGPASRVSGKELNGFAAPFLGSVNDL